MAREVEYMLQTENVIKQYRQSESVITAVNRANIKIEKGEFVAIIGSSGSGKSTFLHICAGLDKANAGRKGGRIGHPSVLLIRPRLPRRSDN